MKGFKSKRGISLIVLVITIIVMIILAAAIILSISNSGIMDKANQAKTESDTANLKEYVNVLTAEWELMTADERSSSGYASKEAYVNGKFEGKGYTNKTYSADGEIYTDLPDITKDALSKGLKIGDEVKYTVTANTYTPDENKTGYSNSKLIAQTNLKWIYVGVSEEGELLITPDASNNGIPHNLTLKGKQGYLTGPDELNTICDELYTTTKGTARSMDIDDVTRILGYTGEKGVFTVNGNNLYPTTEAMKIGDIEELTRKTLNYRSTPESGKSLEDYYSDYYIIDKADDVKEMKNSKYVDLIYPKSGYYWLASSCVYANFGKQSASFRVRFVTPNVVGSSYTTTYGNLFVSTGSAGSWSAAVRPVVSLTSKIQTNEANGSGVWEFVS